MNLTDGQVRAIRDNSTSDLEKELAQDLLEIRRIARYYIQNRRDYNYYNNRLCKMSGCGGNTPENNKVYWEYKDVCKALSNQLEIDREDLANHLGINLDGY